MHQPYTEQIDSSFPISDTSMNSELACYLNACHYTDRQIEKYFRHLKQSGLYDNSLIVIAADHPVHNTDFGGVDKDIPLYLVNVPYSIKTRIWQGACNQIDVYTTLLDLLGIESSWYGLGQSLLSPSYSNIIGNGKWDVSGRNATFAPLRDGWGCSSDSPPRHRQVLCAPPWLWLDRHRA